MKQSICYQSYLSLIRWPDRLRKGVAWLVIVCFSVNCLTPAVVGAKSLARDKQLYAAPTKTEFDKASDALIALEDTLDRMNRRLNGQFEFAWQDTLAQKTSAQPPAAATRAALLNLQASMSTNVGALDAQQPAIQTYFTQTQTQLKARNLAVAIQSRAQMQAAQYAQFYAQLHSLLTAIDTATTDSGYKTAVAAAATFTHEHSSKPMRANFDPKHLAFGPSTTRARQAFTDGAAIRAALSLPDANGQTTQTAPPANLSPTEDVQLTPAIIAKAKALNNNPLQIYQFVRNHVEYLPTYGSIEGSDYTLQTLRGNDIDQASLLIALLRAANIPAHYVYGTIRVPIAQVENWVGGVTDPHAALDLLGRGGVPTLGLAQGGVIKYAQIEHVWVEAQFGFAPSRGAVTTPGPTWVPLDPSFKQYTYTSGMNLQTAVPFDAVDFADHIQSTSTINTTEGWVQNVDQTYINTQLTDYQIQVTDYVNQQNADATVGDVVGTKAIIPETLPLLAASLPYAVTATASRMDTLPSTLRWAFRYETDGQTLLSQSLPSLAGHLMALSFDPATPQDEAALESYIPQNITDPSQLPTSLPAGVVKLKAQFSLDGQTVATGPTYALGDQIRITKGIYQPNVGWQDREKFFTAGDYQAVGLDGAGMSQAQVTRLQTQLQATQAKLQAQDVSGLTKHDLTGALMQTSIENYFVQTWAKAQITARSTGMVTYRMPSYGAISTDSPVTLFFGVPVRMTPKGVLTDMDRIASISVHKDNDQKTWIAFNQASGSADSRTESGVLEQQYSTPSQPLTGITTVQALAVASQQGQRIYTINESNAGTAMAQLQLSAPVLQDIADSVNAGLTVTTSQSTIDYAGQTTAGYIILDPNTGAAAYKIASGADGGALGLSVLEGVAAAHVIVGIAALLTGGLFTSIFFILMVATIIATLSIVIALNYDQSAFCDHAFNALTGTAGIGIGVYIAETLGFGGATGVIIGLITLVLIEVLTSLLPNSSCERP